MLLFAGVILALVTAAPEANAGFRLSIGTGGFYFAVGHHDYYPYYGHQAGYGGGYGATSFSFHNTLNDYGYWQYAPELGMDVWIPYVEYGWRPYTYGHWAYSSYGWTWVSYEPWGWIPHHYGNWTYVDHYGWAWVPGYTWRPHHVNFAVCNGYIGWAPVAPPWYRYSYNTGYHYRGDYGWYSGRHGGHHGQRSGGYYSGIDYNAYVFVDNRNFYGTGIYQHALLPGSGAEMFRAGQVMPLGDELQLDYVKRVTGRSISSVALDRQVYKVNGSEVVHYQPRGQEDLVRQAALPTVNKALAPGFQKHGVSFKGSAATSAGAVNSMFKQGNAAQKTTTFTQPAVSRGMAGDEYYQKQKRTLDNLSRTKASNSGAAAGASSKGRSSTAGIQRTPASGSSKGVPVTSGRSSGHKPRTGAAAGSSRSSTGKSRSVNRGSTSTTSRNRSVDKPPAATRTASVPPRNRPTKPAGPSVTRGTTSRGKAPASTRSATVPQRGKPSKPARTSSGTAGASRGKPAGKPAGKPSTGKTSSGGKSRDEKGKSGKRN